MSLGKLLVLAALCTGCAILLRGESQAHGVPVISQDRKFSCTSPQVCSEDSVTARVMEATARQPRHSAVSEQNRASLVSKDPLACAPVGLSFCCSALPHADV